MRMLQRAGFRLTTLAGCLPPGAVKCLREAAQAVRLFLNISGAGLGYLCYRLAATARLVPDGSTVAEGRLST